jgi:hypothetical protein
MDFQKRQLVSVLISVLALAISFTVNYRENKENSLGLVSTFTYFVFIIMSVAARMLCFQIFAFSLVRIERSFNFVLTFGIPKVSPNSNKCLNHLRKLVE